MNIAVSILDRNSDVGGEAQVRSFVSISDKLQEIERMPFHLGPNDELCATASYSPIRKTISVFLEHNGEQIFTAGFGYPSSNVSLLLLLKNGMFLNILFFESY